MTADQPGAAVCVGIDVGGTFTDAVLTLGAAIVRAKAPTTPDDLGRGVLDACRLAAARAGLTLEELLPRVGRFGLGTTAVTNVLASGAGLCAGLITTKGFEYTVPLARGRADSNAQGWVVPAPRAVERERVVGIDERVDRNGTVIRPLRDAEVLAAGRHLVEDRNVEALAVSFLWSFRYPAHEGRAVAVLRQAFPHLPITSAAALNPVIREYERTTAALLNARAAAALSGVDALAARLAVLGLRVPLLLVHSGGGAISVNEARGRPITLAMSGPAAGVAASVALAKEIGVSDAVTCDMGGTSYDVSVVRAGAASHRVRGELVGIFTTASMIDIASIGAGGGSLAWVDARGMLCVGPRSAGAVPGPACYGRGGTDATITDAMVVLGYLDPERFLGGSMRLNGQAALEGCRRLGARINLDPFETAWGIRQLALEDMAKAVRATIAAGGLDPRVQTLISYGGCGGLFTPEIAQLIHAPRVLVPEIASVFSAFGAATADVRRERARAFGLTVTGEDAAHNTLARNALLTVVRELWTEVDCDLTADGVAPRGRRITIEVDVKFARQAWELAIPLRFGGAADGVPPSESFPGDDGLTLANDAIELLLRDFRAEYSRRYGAGSIMSEAAIELTTARAIGTGLTLRAASPTLPYLHAEESPDAEGQRAVRVRRSGAGATLAVRVYNARALTGGHVIDGPALIDGDDTTIWIPPAMRGRVHTSAALMMEVTA